jgi:ATP-dependent Clp protease ATP-binding subunit ClpC
LQVFDEGTLTDGLGRKVDFKNTIIIMTSNIGARQLKDFGQGVGFATDSREAQKEEHSKGVIEKALKKTFSPEFLNRIDETIVFNSLGKAEMHKIIDIALNSLLKRIHTLRYELEITVEAKDFIADKGFDPDYGARPLYRAIQKWLEDPLAEELLNLKAKEGDIIMVNKLPEEDKLNISIKDKPTEKAKKKDA